jgi:cysteinyl-tRNA synthetase
MQAASEAGKIGGRNTRAADGAAASPQAADPTAQQAAKISKSTGASAFRDLLGRHQPETIRFFLLSTHYRSPIQYSEELLQETARSLDGFYRFFERFKRASGKSFFDLSAATNRTAGEIDPKGDSLLREVAALRQRYLESMDDDFNTGAATAALFELLRTLNKFVDTEKLEAGKPDPAKLAALERGATVLRELAGVLGLFRKPVEQKAAGADDALLGQLVELLIELRAAARKNKDFATGDRIRNRLTELNITLEDRPGGTEWRRG